MKEALFYSKESKGVLCRLCPNLCVIEDGESGACSVRVNEGGKLISAGYGNISSIALDPIEKKPLYHFFPGKDILSIGGLGCNLKCSFCQNWHIAHQVSSTQFISPKDLIALAKKQKSIGIAFTYNEPIINYEYIVDCANLAKEVDLKIVLITNGYILPEPLRELLPLVDAMNIDVKGFTREYYKNVCGGNLAPVKRTVEIAADQCHVELTTLVVGGVNDDIEIMKDLFEWISKICRSIPLHLSRYFPNYQMDLPATPIDTMIRLKELGNNYLDYIYLGNIPNVDTNTYCPHCRHLIIRRGYYNSKILGLEQNKCKNCGELIRIS